MVLAAGRYDEASNVSGALVFFAYIVAALLFTGLIARNIVKLWQKKSPCSARSASKISEGQSIAPVGLSLPLGLALLSFATLSYHMLSFLIESYRAYSTTHGIGLPASPTALLQAITSPSTSRTPLHIWRWSTHSTLFQDFAHAILDKPECWWWTHKALIFSFAWNCWMAYKGFELEIPHLWAYFVLDQILPVSFTQNLFIIAVQLSPKSSTLNKLGIRAMLPLYALAIVFVACLTGASEAGDDAYFIPLILFTRVMLFAPYLFYIFRQPVPQDRAGMIEGESKIQATGADTGFLLLQSLLIAGALQGGFPGFDRVWSTLNDNYAVKALGYDLLIGVGSLLVHLAVSTSK